MIFDPKIKKFTKFLNFVCNKNVIGITLCPFGIYMKNINHINKSTITHENIHWQQQLELFILPFYILYFTEYLIKFFIMHNAYINLSFEREAYNNQSNLNYLKNRKPYAWVKLIFKTR